MTTEHLPRYMTQQDIKRFFGAIKDRRDRALFGVIYLYGLRAGEATLLKVEDVDFDGNKIFIPCLKNGYAGVKPLRQDARKLLKSYVRIRAPHGNALFTTREGTITKRRIEQLFKQYLTKAGLDSRYVVHSVRHSIAVHILDAGEDIAYVQDHLGHRNIRNTQVYAKISDITRNKIMRRLEYKAEVVTL
jgi:site-specific recombinase XerD